jgi:thiol:disulfide interchange protein
MRSLPNRTWFICLIGLSIVAIIGFARLTGGRDRIPWRHDLPAARRESALTHKPLFLDFTASRCGPCQSLKSSTWADANVAKMLTKYVPVQIDVDAHPDLSQQFQVQSIPLFVVLNSDGSTLKRSEGYLDADEFLDWLGH